MSSSGHCHSKQGSGNALLGQSGRGKKLGFHTRSGGGRSTPIKRRPWVPLAPLRVLGCGLGLIGGGGARILGGTGGEGGGGEAGGGGGRRVHWGRGNFPNQSLYYRVMDGAGRVASPGFSHRRIDQRLTEGIQHKLMMKLLEFDFSIQYKKGIHNRVADALSRKVHQLMTLSTGIPPGHRIYMTATNKTVSTSPFWNSCSYTTMPPLQNTPFTLESSDIRARLLWVTILN